MKISVAAFLLLAPLLSATTLYTSVTVSEMGACSSQSLTNTGTNFATADLKCNSVDGAGMASATSNSVSIVAVGNSTFGDPTNPPFDESIVTATASSSQTVEVLGTGSGFLTFAVTETGTLAEDNLGLPTIDLLTFNNIPLGPPAQIPLGPPGGGMPCGPNVGSVFCYTTFAPTPFFVNYGVPFAIDIAISGTARGAFINMTASYVLTSGQELVSLDTPEPGTLWMLALATLAAAIKCRYCGETLTK